MKTNVAVARSPIYTYEGAVAQRVSPLEELRRATMTCLLFENTFYENGSDLAARIASLVPLCDPADVVDTAIKARNEMYLRHVPLFLLRELARRKGNGRHVERGLTAVIQRADEMAEFLSLYWRDKRQPLSAGVKRALATVFPKFSAYALGKYNRDGAVKLRDVLFLCHAKPESEEQAAVWKKLVDGTLESPDTWEVALSLGADRRETFERLLREGKLGGLAVLRNLRNMITAKVDDSLIRERLAAGVKRILPFQFVTAARYAPKFESDIEQAMFAALEGFESLPGKTGLLIDVSGSMDAQLSQKGEATRVDAAAGLAIYLREKAERCEVATFSNHVVQVPARRGFALRDAIHNSQSHSGTYLRGALEAIKPHWGGLDRIIVVTDEQSADGILPSYVPSAWVINVAAYKPGLGYGNGWTHINGWSERVVDYIRLAENSSR